METLKAVRNRYGGVAVSGDDLPAATGAFDGALADSLAAWSGEGVKLVWLRIPATRPRADRHRDGTGLRTPPLFDQ